MKSKVFLTAVYGLLVCSGAQLCGAATPSDAPQISSLTPHPADVVSFNDDGSVLASIRGHIVLFWDVIGEKILTAWAGKPGSVPAVNFNKLGGRIGAFGWPDGKIELWGTGEEWDETPEIREEHDGSDRSMLFSPDGKMLASASFSDSRGGKVRLWDVATQTEIVSLDVFDKPIGSMAFSANGKLLAISPYAFTKESSIIRLYDVEHKKWLNSLRGHEGRVTSLAFNKDGLLASGSQDGTIRLWRLWDLNKKEERGDILVLPEADSYVLALAFSLDGKFLAVSSKNGNVFLWDVGTKRIVARLSLVNALKDFPHLRITNRYARSIAFSPDGKTIALAIADLFRPGEGGVLLWYYPTAERISKHDVRIIPEHKMYESR